MAFVGSSLNLDEVSIDSQKPEAENSLCLNSTNWSNLETQFSQINVWQINYLEFNIGSWYCIGITSQTYELIQSIPMMTVGLSLAKGVSKGWIWVDWTNWPEESWDWVTFTWPELLR